METQRKKTIVLALVGLAACGALILSVSKDYRAEGWLRGTNADRGVSGAKQQDSILMESYVAALRDFRDAIDIPQTAPALDKAINTLEQFRSSGSGMWHRSPDISQTIETLEMLRSEVTPDRNREVLHKTLETLYALRHHGKAEAKEVDSALAAMAALLDTSRLVANSSGVESIKHSVRRLKEFHRHRTWVVGKDIDDTLLLLKYYRALGEFGATASDRVVESLHRAMARA